MRRIITSMMKSTDADFDSVVLLLDFAGVDEATDITDLSNSAHDDETFREVAQAEVDTAVQWYDTNSMILVPTSGVVTTGGSINCVDWPDDADWQFGTGDFTVEIAVRFLTDAARQTLINAWNQSTGAYGWSIQVYTTDGTSLTWANGNNAESNFLIDEAWDFDINVWYHIAVSRTSGSSRLFIDGVQQGDATADAYNYVPAAGMRLGALIHGTHRFPAHANLAGVRITKGVGRYTANFTPPTEFYPTS